MSEQWTERQEASRRTCLANWPDASSGDYNPRCCRFPKSCSVEEPPTDQAMSEPTEQDRETARGITCQFPTRIDPVEAIAAALAAEREKARTPFLALAETMGAEGDPAIRYYANRLAEMVEDTP